MIFGTDGVRGRVGEDITEQLVGRLAAAFSFWAPEGDFVIGRDTRASGPALTAAAAGAAAASGRRVLDLGIASTPLVSFAIRSVGAAGGIVVSASHNPPDHNGVKFFDGAGAKLSPDAEAAIEAALPAIAPTGEGPEPLSVEEEYLAALAATSGQPGTWVLDPAHGALCGMAERAFAAAGHEVTVLNGEPDGQRINVGCGVLDLGPLREAVASAPGVGGGFAFDGDGDRCLAVTPEGEVLDGDDLLFAWAQAERRAGRPVRRVVGTVLSNGGLDSALEGLGTHLLRVGVGDREVATAIRQTRAGAGGEPSGHTVFPHLGPTGDGLATALVWTAVAGGDLGPVANGWDRFAQAATTIPIDSRARERWARDGERRLEAHKAALSEGSRVVVRPSGTESVLRVMVEHASERAAREVLEEVVLQVRTWL